MRFLQRVALWSLRILSLFLMIGVPLYKLYKMLFVGQETKSIISFGIAFVLGVVGIILFVVLKARYKRRLQSIDVADELGVSGTTPIILRRVLLLIEVAFPLAVLTLFLHGLEAMQSLEIPSYRMFLEFEYWFIGGLVVLLIHDYLKRYFIKKNAIMNHILFEKKVEKKKAKIISRGGVLR